MLRKATITIPISHVEKVRYRRVLGLVHGQAEPMAELGSCSTWQTVLKLQAVTLRVYVGGWG